MKRVGAIGRLMVSIALLAASFSIYRARSDPWMTIRENPLGEMSLAFLVILPSAALAACSAGWPGRFFGRLAAAGAVVSMSCWLAPHPIREAILARVLVPLNQRFAHRGAWGLTDLELCLLKTG